MSHMLITKRRRHAPAARDPGLLELAERLGRAFFGSVAAHYRLPGSDPVSNETVDSIYFLRFKIYAVFFNAIPELLLRRRWLPSVHPMTK